jgi:hypothetical protein
MLLVVPAIELGLEVGVDVGPHHQQAGTACLCHRRFLHATSKSAAPVSLSPINDLHRTLAQFLDRQNPSRRPFQFADVSVGSVKSCQLPALRKTFCA